MAQAPYQPIPIREQLRPVAAPVDTYVKPGPSQLEQLAESIKPISKELQVYFDNKAAKAKEEDEIRGKAAYYGENREVIAQAVREGKVPPQYSPAFMRGFKNSQGDVAGSRLQADFLRDYNAWDGKNSEDPEAYDAWATKWLEGRMGTDDPEVLRGLMPHVKTMVDGGFAMHTKYKADQIYDGSLNSNIAGANQSIDDLTSDGLARPEGTDYKAVFGAIASRRDAWVAGGGKPEDFDKSMIDAMSNKILTTRDVGLLKWFDEKVPGTDYTYGQHAYGAKTKMETVNALEVRVRQAETEERQQTTAADKKAKEATERQAVEILMIDPNAPIPKELVELGMKYNPQYSIEVAEWRKKLAEGYTDPAKMQEVYRKVMDGGGYGAIQEAMSAGVFGRTEDLTAAYNFAKGYEGASGKINEVFESGSVKNILNAIDIRTKGKTSMDDPIAGLSDEGLQAQHDYRRMLMEWAVANPEASLMEIEKFAAEAGKSVLERITPSEEFGEAGKYEAPKEQPFENPFVAPPVQRDTGEPVPAAEAWFNGLPEEQKKALEERSKATGMSLDEIKSKMSGAAATRLQYNPDSTDVGEGDSREVGMTKEQAEGLINEAIASSSLSSSGLAAGGSSGKLLDLIGKNESAGNYNAVYGNSRSKVELSNFTLNDILGRQQYARASGKKSTAIGKYQFIYKTLNGLKREMGLTGNEKFTPELQDRLGMHLLKRRGLDAFLSGRLSKTAFAHRLSQEWASLPSPYTGRSYYAGDGLNASTTSTLSVYNALNFPLAPKAKPLK